MRTCVLILAFGLIVASCFAADQPQTQKNKTKKHASSKVLFEPTQYEKVTIVLVKGKEWKYYQFSKDKPLVLEVEGTATLYFRVRLVYDLTMKGDQNFTLTIQEQGSLGLKSDVMSYSFRSKKSSVSTVKNDPKSVPSAAHEFKVTIPNGKHRYFFGLTGTPAPCALMRILVRQSDLHADEE